MKVVELRPKSPYDDPDIVLKEAVGDYSDLVIIGYNHDDNIEIRSSNLTNQEILWLISFFQHRLLNGDWQGD